MVLFTYREFAFFVVAVTMYYVIILPSWKESEELSTGKKQWLYKELRFELLTEWNKPEEMVAALHLSIYMDTSDKHKMREQGEK